MLWDKELGFGDCGLPKWQVGMPYWQSPVADMRYHNRFRGGGGVVAATTGDKLLNNNGLVEN